jgi:hypothetical protein
VPALLEKAGLKGPMRATVLVASGLFRTAAGSIGEQWLKQHAKSIREYFVLRARSVEGGDAIYEEFVQAVRRLPAEQLKRGPTPKARLFLVASGVVQLRELLNERSARSELPWTPIPLHEDPGYREAAELLRTSLPPEDMEILDLHHVRGLTVSDVAYATSATEEATNGRLKAAEAYALMLVEEKMGAGAPALDKILTDAFRLDALPERKEIQEVTPAPLPPQTVLAGRYELEGHVAAGAFGHVYRARDVLVPGHMVAMKMLHKRAKSQTAREGAIRELSLTASVFHPSVVQFKDHGWYDDRLWFVMPWYTGETLQQRIEREAVEPREAFRIFGSLARALAALHAVGIRHQDVKPDNIFLVDLNANKRDAEPDILPVLLDLGGAAPQGDMALVGTPIYFAPELAERFVTADAETPLTEKADVFALALTLMHSLVPSSIDGSALEFEPFVEARSKASPRVADERVIRPFRALFERWIALDPRERPSALELAAELESLADGRSRPKRVKRPAAQGGGKPRRGFALAVFALALGAIAGGGIGFTVAPASPVRAPVIEDSREVALSERDIETARERAMELERELTRARQAIEQSRVASAVETAMTEVAPVERSEAERPASETAMARRRTERAPARPSDEAPSEIEAPDETPPAAEGPVATVVGPAPP